MSSKMPYVVLFSVFAVALASLGFSAINQSGAAVSIAPVYSDVPHVIVSSMPQSCLSDLYCAPDQSCVGGRCISTAYAVSRGLILPQASYIEPLPNLHNEYMGGVPITKEGVYYPTEGDFAKFSNYQYMSGKEPLRNDYGNEPVWSEPHIN